MPSRRLPPCPQNKNAGQRWYAACSCAISPYATVSILEETAESADREGERWYESRLPTSQQPRATPFHRFASAYVTLCRCRRHAVRRHRAAVARSMPVFCCRCVLHQKVKWQRRSSETPAVAPLW